MRSALVLVATIVLLALIPSVAFACPSCFSGTEEGREAFFHTFLLLTTLPLLTVGGVIYWLVRRSRQLERGDARDARE